MSRPFAAKQTTMLRRRSSIVERIINIILNPNRLLYKMMIHRNFKGISLDLLASFPKVKGKTNNLSEIRGAIVYSFPQLFKEPLSLDKHETMICFSESQRKELVDNAHLCQIMRYLTGTFDARFHENSVRSDLCSIVDFQFEYLGKTKGVTITSLINSGCVLCVSLGYLTKLINETQTNTFCFTYSEEMVCSNNNLFEMKSDSTMMITDCDFPGRSRLLTIHRHPSPYSSNFVYGEWIVTDPCNAPIERFVLESNCRYPKIKMHDFNLYDMISNRRSVLPYTILVDSTILMYVRVNGDYMDPECFNPDEQPEVKYNLLIRLVSLSDFIRVIELYSSSQNIPPTSQFTFRPSNWDPQHVGDNEVYIVGEVVIPIVDAEELDERKFPLCPDTSEVLDTSFHIFNDLWFDFDEDTQSFSEKEGTVLFSTV
jgi:hypothetical protein